MTSLKATCLSENTARDQALKILIVEDEKLQRLNYRAMLEDMGHYVVEAAEGEEGLKIFLREHPDLVLTDLIMPVMGGLSLIRKLHEIAPETPIIVISGAGDLKEAVHSLRIGAWDYMTKPLAEEDVDIVLNEVLEKAKLIKENSYYQEHLEELVQKRTGEVQSSEARYRRLLESAIGFNYTVTFVGGYSDTTYFSPGCEALTGFTSEAYGDDPDLWFRMVHEEDRHFVKTMSKRILYETDPFFFKYRIRHKNGTLRWIRNTLVPHRNTDGKLISYDSIVVDITERKEFEKKLSDANRKWKQTFDALPDLISILDTDFRIIRVNKAMADRLGISPEACRGRRCFETVCGKSTPPAFCPHQKTLKDGCIHTEQIAEGGLGGVFVISTSPIFDEGDRLLGSVHVARDVTEFKKLEAQFYQAQKMEAIARLATGVVHDFNNLLHIIMGRAELALNEMDPNLPVCMDLREIILATEHSIELTNQLMAFSRHQPIIPKVLDLNKTIGDLLKMFQRLIGKNISLEWSPTNSLWPIKMDSSQLHQVLTNLCINAKDAISDTGKITIETTNISADERYCTSYPDLRPGDYVLLTVKDDGCGMDEELLGKIFEPFFTTKKEGKGTGLGLATVYGIVKQNNGSIDVASEKEIGTTFSILLPRYMNSS